MPRALLILALLFGGLAVMARVSAQALLAGETPMRIYVGALDGPDPELTHVVRARLVDDLIARGIAVVESEEHADAILTGAYIRQTAKKINLGRRKGIQLRIQGDLSLSSVAGQLLWNGELSSDRYAISQSASFAAHAGKQIDHALDLATRRRNTGPLPWKTPQR